MSRRKRRDKKLLIFDARPGDALEIEGQEDVRRRVVVLAPRGLCVRIRKRDIDGASHTSKNSD